MTRGLNGPWEELSHRDAVKKASQALRDCNRPDRETYAQGVAAPQDVQQVFQERSVSGISGKEYAEKAAVVVQEETQAQLREAMVQAGIPEEQIEEQLKRQKLDPTYTIPGFTLTPNGTFQPIGANIPIGGMHSIGPDGLPVIEGGESVSMDPAMLYAQIIPPVILQVPHPMFEVAPIDMEAAKEARRVAGYRHPTLDPPEEMESEMNAEMKADIAAAAGLETDQQEGISSEIAEAIVKETVEAMSVHDPVASQQALEMEAGDEAVKSEDHKDQSMEDQPIEDERAEGAVKEENPQEAHV